MSIKDKYGTNIRRGDRVYHATTSSEGEMIGSASKNYALIEWDDGGQERVAGVMLIKSKRKNR